jgi:predicted nuclease with TOPRIM domain
MSNTDIAALRQQLKEFMSETRKLKSHFAKMESYYSDWEDRLVKIEKAICEAEDEIGLTYEEIIQQPNAEDVFDQFMTEQEKTPENIFGGLLRGE